jgi:putative Mn2+ efflux pump MntP
MNFKTMLPLAVATSIDAMAVGVSFAFLKVDIVPAVIFIGCITFILSGVGVKIGSIFGSKYKSKAELAGGIVLILMGLKTLLDGLGII